MLSSTGADRLQAGMRGAWGKPSRVITGVGISQIIMSVRTCDSNRSLTLEALRRSQFPSRQKIIISKNSRFTPLRRDNYLERKGAGRGNVDGVYIQFLANNIHRLSGKFDDSALNSKNITITISEKGESGMPDGLPNRIEELQTLPVDTTAGVYQNFNIDCGL